MTNLTIKNWDLLKIEFENYKDLINFIFSNKNEYNTNFELENLSQEENNIISNRSEKTKNIEKKISSLLKNI